MGLSERCDLRAYLAALTRMDMVPCSVRDDSGERFRSLGRVDWFDVADGVGGGGGGGG